MSLPNNDLLAKGSAAECKTNFMANAAQLNNELFFTALLETILPFALYNTAMDAIVFGYVQTA